MRINETNRLNMIQSYQKASQKPDEKKPVKGRVADQVEISLEAQERLKQTIDDLGNRNAKLEELKQQAATGTYEVNSTKIAEKLLAYWKSNRE